MNDLVRMTAREAVSALERRQVSPDEMIDAALERIAETGDAINALPTLAEGRARERARALQPPDGDGRGYLHGLPVAVKDLKDVAGVRSTKGSRAFADRVPERSDILVETIEANGAVVLAKSNTPEFGAGATTFNDVFGRTRNPWDTRLTSGGSSGGTAAALAAGQVWLGTGSDLGGSLRIPASFCSVVGLRTTPGRVAAGPKDNPFATLSVDGPMGRTVGDVALFLDSMAGQHTADPLSMPAPATPYVDAVDNPVRPRRVAYTPDLGIAVLDPEVREAATKAVGHFESIGASVDDATIDFSEANDVFHVLRAHQYLGGVGPLVEQYGDLIKPEVIWNVEAGREQSVERVAAAERARAAIFYKTVKFFETYDLLVSPTVIVPPFDVELRYITDVAGVHFDDYISWLVMCSALALTACPVISVPCGFTSGGLPVGVQIMAPRGREDLLLSAAALFEQATGLGAAVPIDPRAEAVAAD
jgi:amidase